ncbi:MAG: halocyanin domain-containing protein [Halobacteriales archaeon]
MTGTRSNDGGSNTNETEGIARRRVLQGATAAVGVAGLAGAAGAQEAPYGGWFTGATGGTTDNYGGTVDRRDADSVTVTVGAEGNGGPFAFAPAAVRISPETTVNFEWVSNTHNVIPESIPDDAEWEGTPGGTAETYDTGYTYDHTFETEGIYTYFCQPHLGLGMKGAIVVGDADVGEAAAGEAEDGGFTLPGGDAGSLVVLSLLAAGGLGAAAVFGSEAWANIRKRPVEGEPTAAGAREPVVELGHDDFDPSGTLGLVVVYFLILLVLWVFMYFVEFLGRGPTVIG